MLHHLLTGSRKYMATVIQRINQSIYQSIYQSTNNVSKDLAYKQIEVRIFNGSTFY